MSHADFADGFESVRRPGQCPVPFYTSAAAPTFKPDRIGSLCMDTVAGKLYVCTSATTPTWVSVGSQT